MDDRISLLLGTFFLLSHLISSILRHSLLHRSTVRGNFIFHRNKNNLIYFFLRGERSALSGPYFPVSAHGQR